MVPRHVVRSALMAGAFLPWLAAGAQGALLLHGTVRDEQGRAVAHASIVAMGDSGAAVSDARGAFMLRLAGAGHGTRRVAVRRLGFAPLLLHVEADGAVYHSADGTPERTRDRAQAVTRPVDVRLRRAAAPLDAIVVHGRRVVRGPMAGFHARRKSGHGRFFTAEDIERRGARRMTDLLRGVPGLATRRRNMAQHDVRLRGATIAPLVWLDGVPLSSHEVDLDRFDPRTFASIEVYSGSASVPLQFAGGRAMSTSGGTIVLWSREGEAIVAETDDRDVHGADDNARSMTPAERDARAASSALLTRLLEGGGAFTGDRVTVQARLLRPLEARYPPALHDARVSGRVEVEFIVDATGQPRMDTFGVVSSSHPALVEAVRRSVDAGRQTFAPATLDGRAVAQLVQQPFEFRLDGDPATGQEWD